MSGIMFEPQPGLCKTCATAHGAAEPHNHPSLYYHMAFYAAHGRFPTWDDAMAHCTPEVQLVVTTCLREHGILPWPDTSGPTVSAAPRCPTVPPTSEAGTSPNGALMTTGEVR